MRKSFFFSILGFVLYCRPCMASGGEISVLKFAFTLINFAIFAFLIYKVGFSKILSFFRHRGDKVGKDIDEASREKKTALETHESIRAKLEMISGEIYKFIEEAKMQGERSKQELILLAKKKAESVIYEGRILADGETDVALDHLRKNLAKISVELAEKKIRKRLTKKGHSKLIDECINELEAF